MSYRTIYTFSFLRRSMLTMTAQGTIKVRIRQNTRNIEQQRLITPEYAPWTNLIGSIIYCKQHFRNVESVQDTGCKIDTQLGLFNPAWINKPTPHSILIKIYCPLGKCCDETAGLQWPLRWTESINKKDCTAGLLVVQSFCGCNGRIKYSTFRISIIISGFCQHLQIESFWSFWRDTDAKDFSKVIILWRDTSHCDWTSSSTKHWPLCTWSRDDMDDYSEKLR